MTDDDTHRHDVKHQLGIILSFSDLLIAQSAAGDVPALLGGRWAS